MNFIIFTMEERLKKRHPICHEVCVVVINKHAKTKESQLFILAPHSIIYVYV